MKILLTGFLCLLTYLASAQEVERTVMSCGGMGSTNNGQLSHTYGQMFTQTSSNINGIMLSQGFQQPDSMDFVSSIDPVFGLELLLFPSPVTDEARLRISSRNPGSYDILLYDVKGAFLGKPLSRLPIKGGTTQEWKLNLKHLSSGVYLLRVQDVQRGLSQGLKFKKVR